jgi:hypothetical protein
VRDLDIAAGLGLLSLVGLLAFVRAALRFAELTERGIID